MTRTCRRNGCSQAATATLTFRYDTAQAWLADLATEPGPQCWDLCEGHAGSLTVPRGWELMDARSEEPVAVAPPTAPARAGLVSRTSPRGRRALSARRNRYAELSARLPELAAQVTAASPLVEESSAAADAD